MSDTSASYPAAQPGLFTEPGNQAHYLEFVVSAGVSDQALKQALSGALAHRANCYVALAFSSSAWDRLQPSWRPQDLQPFATLQGKYTMPATQTDLLFWIHAEDRGEVMAAVLHIHRCMADVAEIKNDISGFKNSESRDLTGFVDGTANPKEDGRIPVAQIAPGQPGAGGSYVFAQLWQHHLKEFNQLPVTDQERVIGRTKGDNIEMEGDAMPADSHVSRTDVKVDGVGMKIYRRSTPYYRSAEDHGLYFICFACELRRISIQLERMAGMTEDGLSDHLMKYSTPMTGNYWFMPAQHDLEQLLQAG